MQLDGLSVKELQALRSEVDNAIRAAIRAKNQAATKPPAAELVDLERERDAWKARSRH